ncbi:MAG: sugar phosphate isomerase/epimerase, partial [Gammaproteobacteria bacterium]|nr:sugar phosphate isomerase/epimerase [Gammaproteobacteria bacterium]
GLRVSMLTGDLALAANNAQATDSIRNITPYLDLAEALGCELLRVMVHEAGDIEPLRRAADEAGERGMRLAQQCHWGSLAETVEQALALVREVDRSNFGITYEPANLLAAGDEYGATAVERLAPHLFNVYFQNLHLRADSALTFNTRRRGPVGVEFLPIADPRGIDATPIVQALRAVGYAGWFSVHQPCMPGQSVAEAVREAGAFAARHLGSSRS